MTAPPPSQALTRAEIQRLTDAAAADLSVFLGLHGRVLDPNLGDVPFSLWPHLESLIALWTLHRLTVCLKARQLGVSWLMAGIALWTAKYRRGANVLIVSKGEIDAAEVLRKVKYLESRLHPQMRHTRGKDNDSMLEFPLLDSKIRALPSTKEAGRGETATLALMDEFAFHQWAADNWVAIKPTIDAGGRMIVVSTANGLGGAFHSLWSGAGGNTVQDRGDGIWTSDAPGPNRFVPIFLGWSCRPERDAEWLEQQRDEYASLPQGHIKFKQEYPPDPSEAFVVSGRPVFDKDDLGMVFTQGAPLPLPPALAGVRGLTVYALPEKGKPYSIGADVAQGLVHGDASCAIVLNQAGEEVAHLHTREQPDVFAAGLHALATAYPCRLGVERNGPGHQVLYKLRELNRPDTPYHLYYDTAVLRTGAGHIPATTAQTAMPGWTTTGQNKPTLIGELEVAVRTALIRIRTRLCYQQMLGYQRLDNGDTSGQLEPNNDALHDDCVITWGLAWQMRKWPIQAGPPAKIALNTGFNRRPEPPVVWPQ